MLEGLLQKHKLIIIAIALVIIIVIVALFVVRPGSLQQPGTGTATSTAGASANSQGGIPTRSAVPIGITVPQEGQTVASSVAPPQVVAPVNSHTSSDFRGFRIQANSDQFTPNTVIVNVGDVVDILVTAVDKSYDFTQPDYGYRQQISKGQTATIQFGATAAGQFMFYCASCGGPQKGPVGYIDVVAKK